MSMTPMQDSVRSLVRDAAHRRATGTRSSKNTKTQRPVEPNKPPTLRPVQVTCALCSDVGFYRRDLPIGHPDYGKAIRCECQTDHDQQLLFERSLRASNLSGRLLNATLDSYQPTPGTLEAHHALSLFAHEPQGWITLLGGVGTGKTHLLAAVANALLYTTARPLYCVVPEFFAFLRESFETGHSESCSKRFQAVRNAGVLLLDDFGAEKETEWTQEQLYRVINHRYNEGLPTLIASNVPLEELEPRIASRLRDSRIGQVIVLTAPDYRYSAQHRKARS